MTSWDGTLTTTHAMLTHPTPLWNPNSLALLWTRNNWNRTLSDHASSFAISEAQLAILHAQVGLCVWYNGVNKGTLVHLQLLYLVETKERLRNVGYLHCTSSLECGWESSVIVKHLLRRNILLKPRQNILYISVWFWILLKPKQKSFYIFIYLLSKSVGHIIQLRWVSSICTFICKSYF